MKRIGVVKTIYVGVSIFLLCHSVSIMAVELSVQLRNRSGTGTPGGLTFSGASTSPDSAPWVMADQYVEVEYEAYSWDSRDWGLTIVTDNRRFVSGDIAPKPTDRGPVDPRYDKPGPDGVFGTPDDDLWYAGPDKEQGTSDDNNAVTYGGLIDRDYVSATPKEKENPNIRASLCWQVYRDRVSEGTGRNILNSRTNPDNCVRGILRSGDFTDNYNWNSNWAYIIDMGDLSWQRNLDGTYVGDRPGPAYNTVTGLFYDTSRRSANKYFLVAWGTIAPRTEGTRGVLAQHPVAGGFVDSPDSKQPNDSDGDGKPDIVIYIGARFWYKDELDRENSIPVGNYSTRIYIELYHW